MQIKRVDYPVTGKRKYQVFKDGKEFSCYICPCQSVMNSVCTGNGKNETCKDITDTNLGK